MRGQSQSGRVTIKAFSSRFIFRFSNQFGSSLSKNDNNSIFDSILHITARCILSLSLSIYIYIFLSISLLCRRCDWKRSYPTDALLAKPSAHCHLVLYFKCGSVTLLLYSATHYVHIINYSWTRISTNSYGQQNPVYLICQLKSIIQYKRKTEREMKWVSINGRKNEFPHTHTFILICVCKCVGMCVCVSVRMGCLFMTLLMDPLAKPEA